MTLVAHHQTPLAGLYDERRLQQSLALIRLSHPPLWLNGGPLKAAGILGLLFTFICLLYLLSNVILISSVSLFQVSILTSIPDSTSVSKALILMKSPLFGTRRVER